MTAGAVAPKRIRPATPEEFKAGVDQALARKRLIRFTERMYPGYRAGEVHRAIADFLERAISTPNFRGILVVPPRFGKSELASVNLPAFFLGQHPDKEIIAASHTQTLANHFSRQARRKMTQPDYPWRHRVWEPAVDLAADAKAIEQWEVEGIGKTRRGRYQAIGAGGSPAGKGADILLVDDAVKNAAAAESAVERDSLWEWFITDMMTRVQPGGSVVVIGTRWHWDDLIGRIIQNDKDTHRWEILHFPAILPSGESLDPGRWPIPALEDKKRDVGSRVWEALFQGNPTEDQGAILKRDWFPLFDELPPGVLHLIQSWDTAFKTGDTNDWSVCHTYAVTVYGIHLINRFKERLDFVDLERAVIDQYTQFKPRMVYIEDKASGQSLGQVLAKKTKIPYVMVAVPNTAGGKVQRAYEATPWIESGRVHLPRWLPGLDDLFSELTAFPYGAHDDEVDAMVQAVLQVFGDGTPALESASYLDDDDEEDEQRGW